MDYATMADAARQRDEEHLELIAKTKRDIPRGHELTTKVYGVTVEYHVFTGDWRVTDWDGITNIQEQADFMEDNHDEIEDVVRREIMDYHKQRLEF